MLAATPITRIWYPWQDSNPRRLVPKTNALNPLSYRGKQVYYITTMRRVNYLANDCNAIVLDNLFELQNLQ